ncbi:Rhomboid domain-containing protein [Salix suchowensis]|nr:Rhomboid domain-containing protein [Salix suchowensis]
MCVLECPTFTTLIVADLMPNKVKGLRVGFSPQYKARVLTPDCPRYFPFYTSALSQLQKHGTDRVVRPEGDERKPLNPLTSAFFARPISVETAFAQTYTQISLDDPRVPLPEPNDEALSDISPSSPVSQTRQVHLQCADKTVCTATSTVRISSSRHAHLFLVEKYAIGQMFRKLGTIPQFELVEVGIGSPDISLPEGKSTDANATAQPLWRRYRLSIPDFECEIVEVFPCRNMFTHGDEWC